MKKRIWAVLIVVVMVLSLLPVVAFAEDGGDVEIAITTTQEIDGGGFGGNIEYYLNGSKVFPWNNVVTAAANDDFSFKIIPFDKASIESVKVNGSEIAPDAQGLYNFGTISAPVAIHVKYALKESYKISSLWKGSGGGAVYYRYKDGEKKYKMIPGSSMYAYKGDKIQVYAEPNMDSEFIGFEVDGVPVDYDHQDNSIIFDNIQESRKVAAVFNGVSNMVAFEVQESKGGHIEIYQSGNGDPVYLDGKIRPVQKGSNLYIDFYHEDGYFLHKLTCNGEILEENPGPNVMEVRLDNVQEGGVIQAEFLPLSAPDDIVETGNPSVKFYWPDGGNVTPGSTLTVNQIADGEEYSSTKNAVSQWGSVFTAYDIKLVDANGVPYQPGTKVRLLLLLPGGYTTNLEQLYIIHIKSDGSKEELVYDFYKDGDTTYLITETTAFSKFVIVDASQSSNQVTGNDQVTATPQTSNDQQKASPKTGDAENIFLFAALAVAAGGVLIFLSRRAAKA